MATKVTSFTPIGTGDINVDNLPFLPTSITIRMGAPNGTTDTTQVSRCDGWATTSNTSYDSWYIDANGRSEKAATNRLFYHYKASGVLVEGTLVDFHDNGGGNYGVKFNFITNVGGYQVRMRFDG